MKRLFTSESVTEGHPDKVCDQIADAILDDILAKDPGAHVACEVCATTGVVFVMGEITADCYSDISKIARDVIKDVGYDSSDLGFDYNTCSVLTAINEQSPDIAMGVNDAQEFDGDIIDKTGAGDQGMMFGGACTQTPELMPMPIALSRALSNRLTECIHSNDLLRPDGKTQVTVEFDGQGNVIGVDTVVVSVMHTEEFAMEELRKYITQGVIAPVLERYGFRLEDVKHIFINPTGNFVIGGPNGDTGLTGRKIIVDTYGGYFSHGGGAFSGKDPTKVDRSGAYLARYMAKNLVSAGLATQVQVQLAYAIGVAEPVSVRVETFGTGRIPEEKMTELLRKTVDMTPAGIIHRFDLRRPIYSDTAANGHFGVADRPWERTDLAEQLKELAGI